MNPEEHIEIFSIIGTACEEKSGERYDIIQSKRNGAKYFYNKRTLDFEIIKFTPKCWWCRLKAWWYRHV